MFGQGIGLGGERRRPVDPAPELTPGTDLRVALALDDVSIELGLTPNRGDCLSVEGVAREAAVINKAVLLGPEIVAVAPVIETEFPIHVEAAAACPRYLGRVIKGVNPRAMTPLWMRERLRRSGVRSISALVDVTNYVLLELGQPMHAFDLHRLNGRVVVRMAKPNERLRLLDGQEVELRDDTLVIADDGGPVAMAGIMGGAGTAVSDETVDLFLRAPTSRRRPSSGGPAVMGCTPIRRTVSSAASIRSCRGGPWSGQRPCCLKSRAGPPDRSSSATAPPICPPVSR